MLQGAFKFSKIFKYILPEVHKYKLAFYGMIFLFVLRVLFSGILNPLYFKKIIDVLSTATPDHSLLASQIFSLVLTLIVFNIISIAAGRSGSFVMYYFNSKVIRGLRDLSFQKIEKNSYTFFSNTFAGSLVTKARRFVGAFDSMLGIFIYNFLKFFLILIGVFVVLFTQSRMITLIFFVWVVIHIAVVSYFVKKKMKYDILEAEQDSKVSGRLSDVFGNILAVKLFSARNAEIQSFGQYTLEGEKRGIKAGYAASYISLIQGIIILFVQSFLLYIMMNLWLKNQISTGTVVLIQSYMIIVFDQLWDFGEALNKFMRSMSDMKETIDIFETVPDILDPKNPEQLKFKNGLIAFNNVSFKYHVGGKVLTDFNLTINPGERVGFVGHSGAGKSTITKLLLRFVDVTGGAILIDGQDIRSITQDNLRSVISYVPQESILFHRSIRENIMYSYPEATEEEMIAVAKKAHAHEFISKLPLGYETMVGERGVKLSGGERQRVAIARAMLKPAPILILDEATSSLDSISESYIQESFEELMKGKTTIVIAHRLSTIQKMDRIIVLDQGHIAEEGTHKELLAKGGLYTELWNHQTGGFLEE